jgi:hypothetical protein
VRKLRAPDVSEHALLAEIGAAAARELELR